MIELAGHMLYDKPVEMFFRLVPAWNMADGGINWNLNDENATISFRK